MPPALIICVVDDDVSVRESIPDLLQALGYEARPFACAEQFLGSDIIEQTACLILDVLMPGMSGPELQLRLLKDQKKIPIIFISGQFDEILRARVLSHGAVAWLVKPFTEQALLKALAQALPRT